MPVCTTQAKRKCQLASEQKTIEKISSLAHALQHQNSTCEGARTQKSIKGVIKNTNSSS